MPYKIVLIGAGSFSFGTMTVRDLLEAPEMRGSEIVLVDLNEERLDRMYRLARRLNETWQGEMKITATTDRREALPGADIVVGAVERNRYPLWQLDIEIPRKHGCGDLYGETGGPGGFFHTLRQVPLLLEIAQDIEELCPDAWFVNMSNPESRLTLALTRYTNVKTVGVCLGAYITRRNLASVVLKLPEEEVDVKAAASTIATGCWNCATRVQARTSTRPWPRRSRMLTRPGSRSRANVSGALAIILARPIATSAST